MPIKLHGGKEYYTVVERMDMLLEEQGKENYSLTTDVTYESGVVIVKATLILYPNARVYCGHALGELGKAKTLEATETHAIGRCLSAAGWFGSEFASANEMESYQSKPKPKPIPENVNPVTGDESDLITFGKHKGKSWKEVDEGWLKWIVENNERYRDKAQSILVSRCVSKPDNSDAEGFTQKELEEVENNNEQVINEQDKIPF